MPKFLHATRRLFAVACLAALSGVATGCPFAGRVPAREMYRLTLPDTGLGPSAAAATAPLKGTMAILGYATPGIYGEPGIVFRIGESEYGAYPSREWALPLGDQLGVLTERVLARIPVTTEPAVFDPPSKRSQTYLWRGTVREFDEVDRGKQVFGAVRFDVRLVRASDDSLLWSGSARAEREVRNPTMSNIVQALSALADEVVSELAGRARRELAGPRVGTASPAP
jgi:ABC-type uncharacterized transport system auxiliary subunit